MTKDRKKIFCIALFGLYIVTNLILLYFHEAWRDEAQVWLLARDIPFFELPRQMAYEGHPCLWHWVMFPFVRLGLPYFTQNIVAFVIVAVAAYLLIFRSDFPFWVKGILVFSPFFTYYYPVIARGYCMIPLFLMLLAYWYPRRMQDSVRYALIIALLVQTHAMMVVTAFLMCVCYLAESVLAYLAEKDSKALTKRICSLLLPLASALFLLYQLSAVEKSSLLRIKKASVRRTCEKILEKFAEAMGEFCGLDGKKAILLLAVGVLFLIAVMAIKKVKAKYAVGVILVGTFCFQFWFYAMVYDYSLQRLMTFGLLIIWGMWILRTEEGERKYPLGEIAFCAFCLVAIIHNVPAVKLDMDIPYSNGREAAEFIRENIPEDAVIITDNQPECTAIFPYLDKRQFIYAPNMENFTYVVWDDHWMDQCTYDTFRQNISGLLSGDTPVYMISCMGRSNIEESERLESDFNLIFRTQTASVKGEDYQIYQMK